MRRLRYMVPSLRAKSVDYDDETAVAHALLTWNDMVELTIADAAPDGEWVEVEEPPFDPKLDEPSFPEDEVDPVEWRIGFEWPDDDADVEASLCDDGLHRPIIDIDGIGVKITESSTPGNVHLSFDNPCTWEQYERLLFALMDCGLIQEGYYRASLEREMTRVRIRPDKHGQQFTPARCVSEPGNRLAFTPGTYPEETEP